MDIGKLIALANDLSPIIGDVETFAQSPEGQQVLSDIESMLQTFISKVNAGGAAAAPSEPAPSTDPAPTAETAAQ